MLIRQIWLPIQRCATTLVGLIPQKDESSSNAALRSLKVLNRTSELKTSSFKAGVSSSRYRSVRCPDIKAIPSITTTCYDPTAPENLQIVLYTGPKDTIPTKDSTPSVNPFPLPILFPCIKESLTQRNAMFFGIGATSSGCMATAITTSFPLLVLALLIGGIAFSIFRYNVEYQHHKPINLDAAIYTHKPVIITTKEDAIKYLQLPLDKINDKACIKGRVDVLLKRYNKYLERGTSSAPSCSLHMLITTIVKHINTSYNLLK